MKLYPCSEEELKEFFPVKNSEKAYYEQYIRPFLQCINHTDLKLAGDMNSENYIHLFVDVEIKL
jgi:hypothetical protein